ncbi:staygreen family protein [Ammoniphilus sp. CFH 90114]|uniref:staygreen family protein n=1 Tax=Ammoniphilus sp. CFH 90114 TaxID=2493665 RepID=UPI00100F44D5|nr:staygreen family protein [Ammoniphilus sp. CFH 90114]RXT03731.1 hypothetical protein EIZ39_23075 [Ammoniphilus sp. CFH 90114]
MSVFNPQKLSVKLLPPATFLHPIEGRKYTLTHSDDTGELFLDIGYVYNQQAINPKMRDEVLAEWKKDPQGRFYLLGKAYVDGGEFSKQVAGFRFNIFQREMNLALKGIIYGDRPFYANYPLLLDASIFIHYESTFPEYRGLYNYGTPRSIFKNLT